MKNLFMILTFAVVAICVINTGKAVVKSIQKIETVQSQYNNRIDALMAETNNQ